MTKPKKVLKMSDEEILRRRENGESIQDLADKNGVCLKTMQRVLKDMETKKEELHLMDTVGDGTAGFYTVININLKDQEPEAAPKKAKTETPKEQRTACEIRGYLLRIDRILSAAKGIDEDAEPDLYDLVQQLLRSGFDKEFGGKR